jgi:hypothetical protein
VRLLALPPEKTNATESGGFCRNLATDTVHFTLADAVTDRHIGGVSQQSGRRCLAAPRVLPARRFAATRIDRAHPAQTADLLDYAT